MAGVSRVDLLTVLLILCGSLRSIGLMLANRDANTTGRDDVLGQILRSAASAIESYAASNEVGFRRALRTVVEAIQNYLNQDETPAAAQEAA